ncbi:MAG: hypothetical protein NPIRA01_28060 [Nitrospirales bacterium]|nr:MAG: hypothetical protein NPIRA01_28060 [Nitrospirales bacterium]
MNTLPATTTRIAQHTDEQINEAMRRQTENNVALYSAGGLAAINRRLAELEYEWDIERTLEANAASFSLLGLFLGMTVNRRWYWLSAGVAGFLLQHALQGWCPPVPVFRRLSIRTSQEIECERHALKALRGDYRQIAEIAEHNDHHAEASAAWQAASKNEGSSNDGFQE